jgi:hypothetical protein
MKRRYPIWSVFGAILILIAIGYAIYLYWSFLLYVLAGLIVIDFLIYSLTGEPLFMGKGKK